MATEFQKYFDNGILSKTHFQQSKITEDFIKWLIPFIDGSDTLKKINLDYIGKYNSFYEAINKYEWGKGKNKENFNTTLNKFSRANSFSPTQEVN